MTRIALLTAALALGACQSSTPAAPADRKAEPKHEMKHEMKPQMKAAAPAGEVKDGVRTVELKVTKEGFVPTPVTVKKDEPLKLVITRTEEKTCATEIVVPGYDIEKKLPLGETVTVEFTPNKAGELKYGCAMGQMIAGVLMVE